VRAYQIDACSATNGGYPFKPVIELTLIAAAALVVTFGLGYVTLRAFTALITYECFAGAGA
jgi:hypothetical protein